MTRRTLEGGNTSRVDNGRASLHVRDSVLGHGDHADNVALEGGFNVLQVHILDVLDHDLLACLSLLSAESTTYCTSTHIVDEDTQLAELFHMLLDGTLAIFVLHEVDLDNVALAAFLFLDDFFDFFGAEELCQ